jgi:hypothetical protein
MDGRVFMRVRNLDRVFVQTLEHGSTIIIAKTEELFYLEHYLIEKANEVWVYLKDESPSSRRSDDFKMKMSFKD